MTYFQFDTDYTPPALTCVTLISSQDGELLDILSSTEVPLKMLLDTGADISLIPQSTIETIESNVGKLPHQLIKLIGFDGNESISKVYNLTIKGHKYKFTNEKFNLEFAAIHGDEGILGRDVLVKQNLLIFGSKKVWCFNEK